MLSASIVPTEAREVEPIPKDPEEPPDDPVFPAPPAGCLCPPYLPCSAASDLCIVPGNNTRKPDGGGAGGGGAGGGGAGGGGAGGGGNGGGGNGGGGGTGGKPTEAGTGVTKSS